MARQDQDNTTALPRTNSHRGLSLAPSPRSRGREAGSRDRQANSYIRTLTNCDTLPKIWSMVIKRPRGYFVVIKPPHKPHVVLGGPYDGELARLKDKALVEEYIKLNKDIDRILDK